MLISLLNASCTIDGNIADYFSEGEALLDTSSLSKIYSADSFIEIRWKVQVPKTASELVTVEQSLDGGITWQFVADVIASQERYVWRVPNASIAQFKTRARYKSFSGNMIFLMSSENMIIDAQPPVLVLQSLRGGEILKGGSSINILWTAQDLTFSDTPLTLSYSADNGATWNIIADQVANTGNYSWSVPVVDSSEVVVKIKAVDSVGLSSEDVSGSVLSIDSSAPQLSIIYPAGGENILGDSNVPLQWVAEDVHFSTNPIKIEISSDGGITWSTLTNSTSNSGSSAWKANLADTLFAKVRFTATDLLGHVTQKTSGNFVISRALPKLTLNQATQVFSNTDTYTFNGTCDLSASMTITDINVTGPSLTTTVPCIGPSPNGTWTYTTSSFTLDGVRSFSFSQTNNLPMTLTLRADWTRDTEPPLLSSVIINNDDEYAKTPFVNVAVTATDNRSFPLKIRLLEVSGASTPCTFSAGSWLEHAQANSVHPFTLSMGFAEKKVCAWAEDRAGNRSVMSVSTGTPSVDSDVIKFDIGNPPEITSLKVSNPVNNSTTFNTGDTVKIEWTATDVEGLSNKPIYIEYTLDGTNWIPIISEYGNLSGNPTAYSGSYSSFTSPSTGFLQIRLKAKDMAGNYSYRIISNSLNSGAWSIFAGNLDTGIENSARGVTFNNNDSKAGQFAIHPRTGDVYVLSDLDGLLKVDIRTGLVSRVTGWASQKIATTSDTPDWSIFKIPENGEALPSDIKIGTYLTGMAFDKQGRLYLNFSYSQSASLIGVQSTRIYQLDLDRRTGRWYAGGGSSSTGGIAPRDLATIYAPITFDEDNSLYTFVLCNPHGGLSNLHRLVKITQTPEGLPDQVQHIAGNCVAGSPVSGTAALNTPFHNSSYANYSSITVWDHGNKIYYSPYGGTLLKIINGVHYTTAITTTANARGVVYNPVKNVLHVSYGQPADGSIQTWSIPNPGPNGETLLSTDVAASGTGGDCLEDGKLASASCITPSQSLNVNPQGVLLFTDGFLTLSSRPFRIRYVDAALKVQTLAGTMPFYGKDMHKSLMRAYTLGSIYYKTSTEPGSIYTPGFYFIDGAGQVFGRIRNDDSVEILWGNQRRSTALHANGTQTSSLLPLGAPYANDGQTMGFDPMGLPWIRYNLRLISLDPNGSIVNRQTASTAWTLAAEGSNPQSVGLYVSGLQQNISFKNQGVFLMGRYYDTSQLNISTNAPFLRFFDFGNSIVKYIMGGVGGTTMAPDSPTPTNLTSANLSSLCVNGGCSLQFIEGDPGSMADDKLYISEGRSLRVITNPLTPGSQTLQTLFTETAPHPEDGYNAYVGINNLFVMPDQSKVFYLFNGQMRCRTLIGTSSWCNGQSLGPDPAFGSIVKRSNQFTLKDSTTLLLNTGRIVLEYKLPTP